MGKAISRRDFLKLSLLTLSSGVFKHLPALFWPQGLTSPPVGVGRVTIEAINIYEDASFASERVGQYQRDQLVFILKEIRAHNGPTYNNRWYETQDGFIHSGYLQRIYGSANKPARYIPKKGRLGEITIASLQSMMYSNHNGWEPRYQLYFRSVHWITDVVQGPYGHQPWYQITDDLLGVKHYVPAKYVRLFSPAELSPIASEVPAEEKRVVVSTEAQTLTAFEKNKTVFHTQVSTGRPSYGVVPENGILTDTPTGRFHIGNKMPSRHMGDGNLVGSPSDYELLGVPWVCYFHETGAAFHGTYWHDNFGRRMSSGCVNMRNEDAKWLYRWTTPTLDSFERYRIENGTVVDIE